LNTVKSLDLRLYSGYSDNWDDELFRRRVAKYLAGGDAVILDLGAGAGIVKHMNFRGLARRVCGIDPDPRVAQNPHLDEGVRGIGESIPFPDNSFDVVFADNVLEHLAQPEIVLQEVFRVLKPGGHFLAKTPNRFHYMPLIATFTPHRFHQWYNRKRGRASLDTFPTKYLINSRRAVRRLSGITGFTVASVELIEGRPEYMRINGMTYLLGSLYERIVNCSSLFENFRILLVIDLHKPKSTAI
jgi:SAM-dependent methyltransferase